MKRTPKYPLGSIRKITLTNANTFIGICFRITEKEVCFITDNGEIIKVNADCISSAVVYSKMVEDLQKILYKAVEYFYINKKATELPYDLKIELSNYFFQKEKTCPKTDLLKAPDYC